MNREHETTILSFPLFDGFTAPGARSLLELGEVRELSAGEVLFEEGDPPTVVVLLLEGETEVFVEREGHHLTLTKVTPGTIIGELAALCDMPRSASARATKPSAVLQWGTTAFRHLLIGDGELSKRIFATALRTMVAKEQELIEELTSVPVAKHHHHDDDD